MAIPHSTFRADSAPIPRRDIHMEILRHPIGANAIQVQRSFFHLNFQFLIDYICLFILLLLLLLLLPLALAPLSETVG